jgi:hypothetical protein
MRTPAAAPTGGAPTGAMGSRSNSGASDTGSGRGSGSGGGSGGQSHGHHPHGMGGLMMVSPIIAADVSAFEEYLDQASNVITHYLVNVTYNQQSYQLKKRYSEFSDIYNVLKDHPLFANYRFPNKSMFNTHSQFTKERRRVGFDELVKLASALKPMPTEVVDFLELEDDCGPASLTPTIAPVSVPSVHGSTPPPPSSPPPSAPSSSSSPAPVVLAAQTASPITPIQSPPRPVSQPHHTPDQGNRRFSTDSRLPKGMIDVATLEQELNVQKRDYFLRVLPSSTCLASAAYATLVAANVIDITSTTSGIVTLQFSITLLIL